MAAPREVIPIPRLRGWSDTPDTSPYGTAALAENVEKVPGGWIAPRRGLELFNRSAVGLDGDTSSEVALCTEFRGWGTSRMMVVVEKALTGAYAGYWVVSWSSPGNPSVYVGMYPAGEARPGFRPSACQFDNEMLVFCPVVSSVAYPKTIIRIGPSGYLGSYYLHDDGVAATDLSADEGPFLTDTNFATIGCAHESRMFFGGYPDEPSTVRYSGFSSMLIAETNEINVHEAVTGLASYARMLLIFARDSCHVVEFGGQQADLPKPFLREVGCESHNTICPYVNRLAFLSRRGLMSIDQAGNIEHLTERIWPTILAHTDDFVNASVVYYPQRNQLWLLIPSSNTIFVYSVEFKEWYQFRYDWQAATAPQMQALGVSEASIGLIPVVGFVDAEGKGIVVNSQGSGLKDYYGAVEGYHAHRPAWLSHPIMLLGHQSIRIAEAIRLVLRDHGPDGRLRVFWLTEGQPAPADLYLPAQYTDVALSSGQSVARFSVDDKGTIVVTNRLLIPAGTKLVLAVDHLGETQQYTFTEGIDWDRTLGSNDLVAEDIRAAIFGNVGAAVGLVRTGASIALDAAAGYSMSLLVVTDEAAVFPGIPAGITAALTPEADDAVFGTATFVANLGELDFAAVVFAKGVRRGRWIQFGFRTTQVQDFGVRSAEIDTRRQEGRR